MIDNLKFKTPFTSIISGPSGSVKSSFCIRLLQNPDSLCTEHFDGGIIWYYSERTAVKSQQLTVLRNNIRFNEGVPERSGQTVLRDPRRPVKRPLFEAIV